MSLNYGAKVYVFLLSAFVPSSILRGYVLATMWRWFVVPLGMSPLGWAHAYGLAALAQLATVTLGVSDRDVAECVRSRDATGEERSLYITKHLANALLVPLIMLLFGYIAHELMGLPR
jgi:hypothetical protein